MDLAKLNRYYFWLKITFFVPIGLMLLFLYFAVTSTGAGPDGAAKTLVNSLFYAAFLGNIAYLFFLGSLAGMLGKSAALWVILTFIFSGIGNIVSFFAMMENVSKARKSGATAT